MGALFGLYPRTNRRVPHISLVFREMWDTAGLPLKLPRAQRLRTGAPCSHQRTWAENDGRSPTTALRSGPTICSLGPDRSAEQWRDLRLAGWSIT
jgi:hypothetical protein